MQRCCEEDTVDEHIFAGQHDPRDLAAASLLELRRVLASRGLELECCSRDTSPNWLLASVTVELEGGTRLLQAIAPFAKPALILIMHLWTGSEDVTTRTLAEDLNHHYADEDLCYYVTCEKQGLALRTMVALDESYTRRGLGQALDLLREETKGLLARLPFGANHALPAPLAPPSTSWTAGISLAANTRNDD